MAHSHHEHRAHKASHSRVGHIMKSGGHAKHRADGGSASSQTNEASDPPKNPFNEQVSGHARGGRLNKYARGGAAKKHGTQVNIAIVAPHGKHQDQGAGPGAGAAPGAPPPMPPHPPVAGPPGGLPPGLPPGGPPGGPPGLMPRPPMKRGGRVKRGRGGKVSHMNNPLPAKPTLPSKMTGGADSGVGRQEMDQHYRGGKFRGQKA